MAECSTDSGGMTEREKSSRTSPSLPVPQRSWLPFLSVLPSFLSLLLVVIQLLLHVLKGCFPFKKMRSLQASPPKFFLQCLPRAQKANSLPALGTVWHFLSDGRRPLAVREEVGMRRDPGSQKRGRDPRKWRDGGRMEGRKERGKTSLIQRDVWCFRGNSVPIETIPLKMPLG